MEDDADVFVLGEDVGAAGGALKLTEGLFERFGPERVLDTPIAEQAIVGTAIGAAAQGLRPVAEIMFSDFAGVCFDGIANELPEAPLHDRRPADVPVTIRHHQRRRGLRRPAFAAGRELVPQHPGAEAGPARDARRTSTACCAVRSTIRTRCSSSSIAACSGSKGEVADDPQPVGPRSSPRWLRQATHVTVVAAQLMRHRALEVAERLAGDGI